MKDRDKITQYKKKLKIQKNKQREISKRSRLK